MMKTAIALGLGLILMSESAAAAVKACKQRASEAVGTNTVWSAKIVRNI